MAWFINLVLKDGQERTKTLIDGVDVEALQNELCEAVGETVVRIPTRMNDQIRESPTFLRPGHLVEWQIFHYDGEVVE